jgi:hypothetical protein
MIVAGVMKLIRFCPVLLLGLLCAFHSARGDEAENPFAGYWALTLPGGRPGWLGVESDGNGLNAEMLWAAGSVFKLDGARPKSNSRKPLP